MMRFLDWILRREPEVDDETRRVQQRHMDEVLARAEGRLNEQKRHTRRAVADNPIAHRIRARPAYNAGGRNVSPK